MNTSLRKVLKYTVPTAAAAGSVYFLRYRQKMSWKETGIFSTIVLVVVYIINSQILKAVADAPPKPLVVPEDGSSAGGTGSTFDPKKYADALYNDIYTWGMRNVDVYRDLNALSNSELAQVYNYWNKNYFHEDSETMTQAIASESWSWFDTQFRAIRDVLVQRLKQMGAQ